MSIEREETQMKPIRIVFFDAKDYDTQPLARLRCRHTGRRIRRCRNAK